MVALALVEVTPEGGVGVGCGVGVAGMTLTGACDGLAAADVLDGGAALTDGAVSCGAAEQPMSTTIAMATMTDSRGGNLSTISISILKATEAFNRDVRLSCSLGRRLRCGQRPE
jgi:hypothetical protein